MNTKFTPCPARLRFTPWLYGLFAIALVLSVLLFRSSIYAQEEGDRGNVEDPADPSFDFIAYYAEGLNVSYSEAQRRLELQDRFGLLRGELYEQELAYGGGWTEHDPDFHMGLHFSDPNGEALLQAYADEYDFIDQIQVKNSPYSLRELERIADALFRVEGLQRQFDFSTGINTELAKVIVGVENPEDFRNVLQSDWSTLEALAAIVREENIERFLDIIEVEYDEPAVALQGTYWPYYNAGEDIQGCSAGLALRKNGTSEKYASTAFHCADKPFVEEPTPTPPRLGITEDFTGPCPTVVPYPTPLPPGTVCSDVRVIDVDSPWIVTDRIVNLSIPPYQRTLIEDVEGSRTTQFLGTGDYLAHWGNPSRHATLQIEKMNVRTWVNGLDGYVAGFIRAKVPSWVWGNRPAACSGDSGGPVFQPTSVDPKVLAIGNVSYASHKRSDTCHPDSNGAAQPAFDRVGIAPLDTFPSGYTPLTYYP